MFLQNCLIAHIKEVVYFKHLGDKLLSEYMQYSWLITNIICIESSGYII